MPARAIFALGALLGGLGVALGAFGADWLTGAVTQWNLAPAEAAHRLDIWEVAVRYQMYHAVALCLAGLLAQRTPSRWLAVAAWLWVAGVAVFSGCLYALVLSGVKILGAIVPLGGVALIVGWIALALAAWQTVTERAA